MISLPSPPKIIDKKDNLAVFEIEGLSPGYGVTIGNSLRRVLLSSLPGAAVTQVKIKGVPHEFSTIPGVMEDTITILLNLKQLRFKLYAEEPQEAKLQIKGTKTVKGANFTLPSQVELMNQDAHVATLTDKKAELDIIILIEKGMGYEPVELRKKGKLETGTIALDAIFTPVRKVSYRVENMRVGERTDFDRLILELETDGTLTPEEAFSQASETLIKHFALFEETFKKLPVSEVPAAKEKKKPQKKVKKVSAKKPKKHAQAKKRKKTK
ncbi:MAG: DNA-directed RNA polymerase subunit alpha [Candidatus Nealsonbacteria bacterium CG09_land_8_20_14_0_10_42_14]|uniref:DNA-directed RNA polymerase subunit alpha n=1 Tax=Candidatus Nealsonbacteria bacterium CG09_land_8_20_14_0_10_42_14 TaxID=1974707 RepID=A0A2H0WXG7_9BACT|nr:MAG: DNA-directed RNA polymerase subunit alpha [Candidatus Nealsonbacteria bacterium CG09_land_8_20_14_0_10_42_14]